MEKLFNKFLENEVGSPVDFYLSRTFLSLVSDRNLVDLRVKTRVDFERQIRNRRDQVNYLPTVYNDMVNEIARFSRINKDDYRLSPVIEARTVADDFVKVYRQFGSNDFLPNSKARVDYLIELISNLKGKKDNFWVHYRELEFYVFSIVEMGIIEQSSQLFQAALKLVTNVLEMERKQLKEHGNPVKEITDTSSVFNDDEYNFLVDSIINWKLDYLKGEIGSNSLDDTIADMKEKLAGTGVIHTMITPETMFPTVAVGRPDIGQLVIFVATGIRTKSSKYIRTPDYRPLLIFTNMMMESTTRLCRSIHVLLNNNTVYDELYKNFLFDIELQVQHGHKEPESAGELTYRHLKTLYQNGVIPEETYLHESNSLVERGWLHEIEIS